VGHSLKELSSNDQLLAGTGAAGVAAAEGAGAVELVGAAALVAGGGAVLLATQASKSAWLTTFTSIGMKLWSVPHSCEHWP
jgi:hypothetical protein